MNTVFSFHRWFLSTIDFKAMPQTGRTKQAGAAAAHR